MLLKNPSASLRGAFLRNSRGKGNIKEKWRNIDGEGTWRKRKGLADASPFF
jgi:hypothetical protein